MLPLRTRREMIGALVIAANDPDRAMTDDKLPLAEVLAERAALAIENAKLYTEQVEARRKVEDLSRLKDEFLSIASHELRTPVTSIKGYTQLAKMLIKEGDLDTSEEYLDIALDQIDRMSRLILELLDVSRIETGRLEIRREPIAWPQFVRDVVHRHHTAVSDRRFHVSVPDDGKIVTGDRDRLEQVLGNLLENAVKYSPDGSDVTVTVDDRRRHARDRGVRPRHRHPGRRARSGVRALPPRPAGLLDELRRPRPRPLHHQADHRAPRRLDLGGEQGRAGHDVLLLAARVRGGGRRAVAPAQVAAQS